ncbi:MAG TPA: polyprenyl synthetase family protein [Burkholderiales bacterium]|nr:polyprenyl synthetase family protein [Burkholderiales bacterium]
MAAVGLERYRARVDAELEARLPEWFPGAPAAHLQALRGILADGKRLRGGLACLVAEALGAPAAAALPAAIAIELVQAASLVHDDLIDGDIMRRGRPAAWTALSPRRAVLVADLLFAAAIERMARLGHRECAAIAEAIGAMAQGALLETEEHADYRRIIALKTGSLFAAAARLGALAAGASEAMVDAATRLGAAAGGLYQIADDRTDGAATASMDEEAVRLAALLEGALKDLPSEERLAEIALTFAPRRSPSRTA